MKRQRKEKKFVESHKLKINADRYFIDIFKNSKAISTLKGKSPFLVRAPKQNKDQLLINKISEEKKEIMNKVTLMKKEIEALKLKV